MKHNGITVALINVKGYSNTTRKHISEAYRAVEHLPRIKMAGIGILPEIEDGLLETQGNLIDDLMGLLNKKSFYVGYNPVANDSYLIENIEEFNKTCILLGFKQFILEIPNDFKYLVNEYVYQVIEQQKAKKSPEGLARSALARDKRIASAAKKALKEIDAWKAGAPATNAVRELSPMMLRIKDNEVNTSHGANVSVSLAALMLRRVLNGKAKLGDKVGPYTLDYVDKEKDIVRIGCHVIALSEAKNVLSNFLPKLKVVQ